MYIRKENEGDFYKFKMSDALTDRETFTAAMASDKRGKSYADHPASFLSRQVHFCNPVLAAANGLLLFSAEHRKFAERK